MPDLSAAEIIKLLREHPVCCGRLSITVTECEIVRQARCVDGIATWHYPSLGNDDTGLIPTRFRRWLTGACVEWCDERGITTEKGRDGYWQYDQPTTNPIFSRHPGTGYPTRLHALLAAIERHEETT